jgi:hypothetical protein
VTTYFTGTTPLDDVWDTLDQTYQLELVDSVILAMNKLQKLDLSNLSQSLAGTPYILTNDISPQPVKIAIGGPALGYFPDVKKFLGGLLQASNQKSPGCQLLEIDSGITLQSAYEDIGRIDLSHSELDELQHHTVFCHNDLEPRNILVRKASSGKYELAGVIDWEMAGFFPFAYEYGLKDTVLGTSNLSFSWYTMFKNQTSHLLPRAECHTIYQGAPDYRQIKEEIHDTKCRHTGSDKVGAEGTGGGIFRPPSRLGSQSWCESSQRFYERRPSES